MTEKVDPSIQTSAELTESVKPLNTALADLKKEGIVLTEQKGAAEPAEITDFDKVDPENTIAVNTDALKTALAAKMKDAKVTDDILKTSMNTAITKAAKDFEGFIESNKGKKFMKTKKKRGKKPIAEDEGCNKKLEGILKVLGTLTKKDEVQASATAAKDMDKMSLMDLTTKANADAIILQAREAAKEAK